MKLGTHRAKVINKQWSGKPGEEYIAVRFARVDAPDETELWSGFLGAKVDSGGKTQQQRTEDSLRATGWNGDYADISSIGSTECEIVVQEDTYNGRAPTNRIRFVQPLGTAAAFMPKALDPADVKRLADRMAKKSQPADDSDAPF